MTGSTIVNNLAGLMMLTSLFVISVKSYRLSCGFYACQSLVLVSIFATLSCLFAAEQLLIWSASAFITKVLLVPLIMTYAARNIPPEHPGKSVIRSGNDGTARGVNCPALRICRSAREATDGYRAETSAGGGVRSFSAWPAVHCQPAQYPAANFWLLPDGKRLPPGAGASCLASTGTGGNRYRYRRHLRRHCDGITGKKNMAYPRHAGREQLDRAEGIMR